MNGAEILIATNIALGIETVDRYGGFGTEFALVSLLSVDTRFPRRDGADVKGGASCSLSQRCGWEDSVCLQSAQLRRSNPDQLFDLMAQLVAGGYAKKLGATS